MDYFFKTKVENHLQIKEKLLEQINLIPNNPFINKNQNIIHTDWNLPPQMHREYSSLFFDTVKAHVENIAKSLNCLRYEIGSYWFQQYLNSGFHTWHTHKGCHFTNIYFIECPKGSETKFKNIEIDIEEGDIISFPSFIPHSSPHIKNSKERKTIISFNTDFYILDD
mgnify:CR=1 FL=1